jgi:hypothetical protein
LAVDSSLLIGTQRFKDAALPGSDADTQCRERDDYRCVLTKKPSPQAAHVFPQCLLQPRPKFDRNKMSSAIPDFWQSLAIFWGTDQVNKWKNTIFPDGVGVERCFNLISLSAEAHDMWKKGLFAFKPLKLSRDRKTLSVQFFWQVPDKYKVNNEVDLLTEPPSSEGLDMVGEETVGDGYFLARHGNDRSLSRIRSGDTFNFTTKDPKNLPLPSLELLEMQWILQRLVGMSGAAGWPSLDEIDDDSVDNDDNWLIPDHTDYNVYESLKRVREWVAEEAADIPPEMFTPETSTATPGH